MELNLIAIITELIAKYPVAGSVLAVLGTLLVVAQFVVPLTSSKKDDELIDKIKSKPVLLKLWNFFLSFAPFQKGAKGIEMSATNVAKK